MTDNENMTMDEEYSPDNKKRMNWAHFVESEVVAFFDAHELERMTLDDGTGSRAKLARTKSNGIKIEYTSSVVL